MADLSKTLFVTDLDGTLLNSDMALSDRTVELLNEVIDKGVNFTFASARSWNSAYPLLERLNLKVPAVTYNGAFIVDPADGSTITSHVFEKPEIDFLKNCFADAEIYPLVYAEIDGESRVSWIVGKETSGIQKYIEGRKGDQRLRPVDNFEDLVKGDVFYFTAIGAESYLKHLEKDLRESNRFQTTFQADVYIKDEFWLEIMHADATKAKGVNALKKLLGMEKIICFGDNINDIPMFKIADEGYAVENAHPRLTELATGKVKNCNNDGVASFIYQYAEEYLRNN